MSGNTKVEIHRISLINFEDSVYIEVLGKMAESYIKEENTKNLYAWFYAVPIYEAWTFYKCENCGEEVRSDFPYQQLYCIKDECRAKGAVMKRMVS